MSNHEGPWGAPPPPEPKPAPAWRWGLILWLALLAALVAGFLGLQRLFPGQFSPSDQTDAWYALGFLALVSSRLVFASRLNLSEHTRNAAIWVGVVVLMMVAFTFRDELKGLAMKVRSEIVPGYAVATAPHTLAVSASEDGGYYVVAEVNGTPVRFAVDTGASDIVLSPADARRLGIDLTHLDFSHPVGTANGVGYGAYLTVDRLTVGPIALTRVPVFVNRAAMKTSLLGRPFLERLASFEIRGGRLFLTWRG